MNGLIRSSLKNPIAVTVLSLAIVVLGTLSVYSIPIDILPVFRSPAVQTLVFYGGMPAASIEKNITARLERGVVQATGGRRLESRSIVGVSIVRDYFRSNVNPSGALTETNSLAGWEFPTMPPGTLPPVVLPYDPTGTTPVCLLALDSPNQGEAALFDTGRYEVRPQIMSQPGANAPLVYGGKVRAIMLYLDRVKLQARHLSPLDVLKSVDEYNVFLPTGSVKFGTTDYAIDSNSMFDLVGNMGQIPLRNEHGNAAYLADVATPKDANFIQTNIVRVNGKRQVYVPVFRQAGASTLQVVDTLRSSLETMKARLTRSGIDLKLVMDQSVYVRQSIESLAEEGVLGAVLCSLVILLFLGDWRMTIIAFLTIPIAVLAAMIGLNATGNTVNVMTLAGLALSIGPLVDSAIICLENTHRHLGLGATPEEAAYLGASEVAMPALVACICTLLVLAPLALMPGLGEFLYRPMAASVAFAMISAYLLSQTLVPSRSARWLRAHASHGHVDQAGHAESPGTGSRKAVLTRMFSSALARWEGVIETGIRWYVRQLERVMKYRLVTVLGSLVTLVAVLALLGTQLRREFFPEVDAGAFEIYARAASGTRIEETEKKIARVEKFVRDQIGKDVQIIISELGVVADLSAAYTPNAGPMDGVIKVQLVEHRHHSAQEYVRMLRAGFANDRSFSDLEFAFDAGGMIRSAMNEGKSSPINIRISGKDMAQARKVAELVKRKVTQVNGVVDARIIQRLDYPQYIIDVDRSKAADLGLNQAEVMKNVVAAMNSSIQFHKKNFWIDPVSRNQYFVGVQYFEEDIDSVETLLDIPITSPKQSQPIPLRNFATLRRGSVPTEITHTNLQSTIDLTMSVDGRDLGHVADDVTKVVNEFGESNGTASWIPYDPSDQAPARTPLKGASMELSGEYSRMQETFSSLGIGLILATMLIYFLMAGLFKSYLTPLVILFAVPLGLIGVVIMLFVTGSAINVQSLLGVIFMVGIVVSNTVLLVDFAQNLRVQEGLTPDAAIRKAASIRVRPVVMTALASFFALIPMALALGRGSEANGPLGRSVIGGIVAGMLTTLFVVPSLYSLVVRDSLEQNEQREISSEDEPIQEDV
ncbi:efflux RND transporter permease subunit [Singulisphaera acidiphila]|uniref:Cation/multidrug efflux pump n=1 Tax=Singulisphaera acidiphila (strain ATCC BAA-1392 / DSM 18658 / VKM B-2454 / MOB10) TaxID=886293 RepID=L0DAQ0_SINAD|nr:efflux RND transporter permease subunit [Singulisphaera acidiphila]AGA26449.1 cation/multidrug efflux pump [Singulisphaera acidiphila DSM 18658]